jgi:hypothetical protein
LHLIIEGSGASRPQRGPGAEPLAFRLPYLAPATTGVALRCGRGKRAARRGGCKRRGVAVPPGREGAVICCAGGQGWLGATAQLVGAVGGDRSWWGWGMVRRGVGRGCDGGGLGGEYVGGALRVGWGEWGVGDGGTVGWAFVPGVGALR